MPDNMSYHPAFDSLPVDLLGMPLTPAETELTILFVTTGKRNKELAFKRNVTVRTIKNQLTTIYAKTGVINRSQLILWATKNGL